MNIGKSLAATAALGMIAGALAACADKPAAAPAGATETTNTVAPAGSAMPAGSAKASCSGKGACSGQPAK